MALQNGNCYFLITPDPAQAPTGLVDATGRRFFNVKFGDGPTTNRRYTTHNGSFLQSPNQNCTPQQTYAKQEDHATCYAGKLLEHCVMKEMDLQNNAGTGELWRIHPPTNHAIGQLIADLNLLATNFPTEDLGLAEANNAIAVARLQGKVLDEQAQAACKAATDVALQWCNQLVYYWRTQGYN